MTDINLSLSTGQVHRILGFLGYGNPSAPVWFIGIEEGLGEMTSEDTMANLIARSSFDETMDLREAHLRLCGQGKAIDIENKPPTTQVWKWMAKIMRARGEHEDWCSTELANEYIRFRLGRHDGETFLTELSPIPSKKGKDKTWSKWFVKQIPDFSSRIMCRRERLRQILDKNNPTLIVCYGIGGNLPGQFADLLGVKWGSVCPRVSASEDRKRLLLPFFGVGQMRREVIQALLTHKLLERAPDVTKAP